MGADFERLSSLFQILNPNSSRVTMLTVPGNPWSKSRPRLGRGGRVFQPEDDASHEEATGWVMRRALGSEPRFTGNVAVGAVFFRSNMQRIDSDNMMKHICDSGNGILWDDDSQITAQIGIVEYDHDHPRTIVVIAEHISTMKRGTDRMIPCPSCDKPFNPYTQSGRARLRCAECFTTSKRGVKRPKAVCPTCGKTFTGYTSKQKYCSSPCVQRKGKPRAGPR